MGFKFNTGIFYLQGGAGFQLVLPASESIIE
jgi:hypothetical protein